MHLQAGEWSLEFRDGDLRHMRACGVEAVERVYFALRDENWGTPPFAVSNLKAEIAAAGFSLSFDAEHKAGPIRFRWHGVVEGSAEGSVRYQAAGVALSPFKRNRIGLCVHHPLDCAGRKLAITHTAGQTSTTEFPRLVSPHQPVLGIRSMAYPLAGGRTVEIEFGGEVWEMEDQRNWSDANFKTYPTPLALPYPVQVAEGTRIEQSVEIRLRQEPSRRELPLGLTLDATEPQPGPVERLQRLRLSHLRLEQPERMAEAARWNLPLELALTLSDDPQSELAAIRTGDAPLARVIVYRRGEPVASARWVELARARFPGVPVLPGSDQYFAELNRNRASDFSQGVAFGLHPQVHAVDDESIMANLAAHESMLETVRAFTGGARVSLSPVTFCPRGQADPRLQTVFGSAWTRGAAANFERLGAASATFHTVGDVLRFPALESVFL